MQARYSPLNQAMHWITALCMFALLPLAWVMVNVKPGAPFTGALFNWHKTLGAIVLIVTAFRIAWRFLDPPPPYPPAIAAWERAIAHAIYWLFLALMIFMPVTGYLSSAYGGHALKLFDVLPTPQLVGADKGLGQVFTALHLWGQWAVYALITLHLGAVAIHLIWGKDGLLGRMLPSSAAEPAQPQAAPPPVGRPFPEPRGPLVRAR
jgi:cytochrome b561